METQASIFFTRSRRPQVQLSKSDIDPSIAADPRKVAASNQLRGSRQTKRDRTGQSRETRRTPREPSLSISSFVISDRAAETAAPRLISSQHAAMLTQLETGGLQSAGVSINEETTKLFVSAAVSVHRRASSVSSTSCFKPHGHEGN